MVYTYGNNMFFLLVIGLSWTAMLSLALKIRLTHLYLIKRD